MERKIMSEVEYKQGIQYMLNVYDHIHLSSQDIQDLFRWRKKHLSLYEEAKDVLINGVIDIDNSSHLIFESRNNNEIHFMFLIRMSQHEMDFVPTLVFLYYKDTSKIKVVLNKLNQASTEEQLQQFITSVVATRESLMVYMEHYKDRPEYIQSKTYRKPKVKKRKSKGSKKKKVTYLTNKVYSISFNHSSSEGRTYERHTESWNVRGHLRHYKSGKVSWVRPYKKGSGKVENKIYKLSEKINK